MEGDVARLAQRKPVVHVVAQFWEQRPRLNVVSVYAALVVEAAFSAGVLVAATDSLHPAKVSGRTARILIGRAAAPVPVTFSAGFWIRPAAALCGAFLNLTRRLFATAQGWARNAGLQAGHLCEAFRRIAAHAPLMAVHEPAMLALDHPARYAGMRDNRRRFAASALAQHAPILQELR
jgi:hypothetical protein